MAAEAEQGGERTEDPSQKRLQDARERGQVPRSRELTTFATMTGGSAMLAAIGSSMATCLSQMLRHGLSIDPQRLRDPDAMLGSMGDAALSALTVLLPVFGALIGVIFLASLLLGGWNFSMQAMAPDFTRLNPLAGIKRLFGLRGASELGKALLKLAVVGGVCAAIVSRTFREVLGLAHMEPRAAIGRGVGIATLYRLNIGSDITLISPEGFACSARSKSPCVTSPCKRPAESTMGSAW